MDELALIKLYMELTGASESQARGVFMHVVQADNVLGVDFLAGTAFEDPAEDKLPKPEPVRTRFYSRHELSGPIMPALSQSLSVGATR